MTFDDKERALLAALGDVLIPANDKFPSASDAGVAGEGLDKVLSFRPDLAEPLKQMLAQAEGKNPADVVAEWQTNDATSFGLLTELVPAAYFLNPHVREQLGYHGQTPHPIDPHPDYEDDDLLQSVLNRGPIYRSTPNNQTAN